MKNLIYLFSGMTILLVFTISCEKVDESNNATNTFTDPRDGNIYKTVKIGDQIWMGENLKYLPSVVGHNMGAERYPYYYVYEYNGTDVDAAKATTNYMTYGVLYNWEAAKKACPPGWHLPSDKEWTKLEVYLAYKGYNYDRTIGGGRYKIGKSIASTSGWMFSADPGSVGNTDYPEYRNKSGFSALPGGCKGHGGTFIGLNTRGFWWSATNLPNSNDNNLAWERDLSYYSGWIYRTLGFYDEGFSVRCIRD